MNQIVGVLAVVVGIILMVWGLNASQSADSQISGFFTSAPSDGSVWLVVAGAILALIGSSLIWPPWRPRL